MTFNLIVHTWNNPQSLTPDWLRGKTLAVEQFQKKITVIVSISEITCNPSDLILRWISVKVTALKKECIAYEHREI